MAHGDTFADIAATILEVIFHCTKMCRKEVRRILGRIRLEPLRQPVKYVTINAIRRMTECAVVIHRQKRKTDK